MKKRIALLTLFILALLANAINAQDSRFIVWVYDANSADSQFGYYDGGAAVNVGGVFNNHDIEGLACLNNVIYGSSGRDGRGTSELYRVVIDAPLNRTTLTKVGNIETSTHEPFYEVAALSEKNDGTLWGYANDGSQRGIISIDPTTAVAKMIKPSRYKVEGIEWLDDTLWLVGDAQFYTWTEGAEITKAFKISSDNEVEALDVVDGLLWIGIHQTNVNIIAIDPATGATVPGGFKGRSDIESLTYCTVMPVATATPTTTNTPTPTASPTPTVSPPPMASPTATASPPPTVTATTTQTPHATVTAANTPPPTASVAATPSASVTTTSTPAPNASVTTTTTPMPTVSATATSTPKATPTIATLTPTLTNTPFFRTTPNSPTPDLTPSIPTNEEDDDEPGNEIEIFMPISHR